VYQDLVRINKAIRENALYALPALVNSWNYARLHGKAVHFIGLVSDGGVHSHIEHLKSLVSLASQHGVKNMFVHAFTDGRDTDPHSGLGHIIDLAQSIEPAGARIASVIGRYYAMDRDQRWERIRQAYDLLVHGKGKTYSSPTEAVQASYDENITDEFILPSVITEDGKHPIALIGEDDVVICFNYRSDRCREITRVLTQEDMPEHGMHTLPLRYVTMTSYDDTYKDVHVIFEKTEMNNTLGEVLAKHGITQLRIAETEKYPHVSFFFSGGREKPFDGEKRVMIPSPKVATYDLKPAMSAHEVADAVISEMQTNKPGFVCLNFANPDMVGHTGVYAAIVEAVETTDRCVARVVETGLNEGYSFIITADHGNAEYALNEDGTPNTAHTTNQVPVILIDKDYTSIHDGRLADIAPTVLKMMGIEQPAEMDGKPIT
jgi:2,3-bisphosphoglycerate-independent phosphoglycerate mutase